MRNDGFDQDEEEKEISDYSKGFLDALQLFSQELTSYSDFIFDNGTYGNEQVDAILKMEKDMQQWLVEKIEELSVAESEHDGEYN